MKAFTTRHMFRVMFQYARIEQAKRPYMDAFWLAESAAASLTHNFGYDMIDVERLIAAEHAVLWAMHWRFKKPLHALKIWQSERRYAIDTIDGVMQASHPGPMLPG